MLKQSLGLFQDIGTAPQVEQVQGSLAQRDQSDLNRISICVSGDLMPFLRMIIFVLVNQKYPIYRNAFMVCSPFTAALLL